MPPALAESKIPPSPFSGGFVLSAVSPCKAVCDLKIVFKLKNREEKSEIIRTFVKKFVMNGNEKQCKQAWNEF